MKQQLLSQHRDFSIKCLNFQCGILSNTEGIYKRAYVRNMTLLLSSLCIVMKLYKNTGFTELTETED